MSQRSGVLASAIRQLCDPPSDEKDYYTLILAGGDSRGPCVKCLRESAVCVPGLQDIALALSGLEGEAARRGRVQWDKQTCFQMAQAYAILALASPEAWKHDALREDFRTRNALACLAENFLLEGVLAEFGASRTEHQAVQEFFSQLTAGLSTLEETAA